MFFKLSKFTLQTWAGLRMSRIPDQFLPWNFKKGIYGKMSIWVGSVYFLFIVITIILHICTIISFVFLICQTFICLIFISFSTFCCCNYIFYIHFFPTKKLCLFLITFRFKFKSPYLIWQYLILRIISAFLLNNWKILDL